MESHLPASPVQTAFGHCCWMVQVEVDDRRDVEGERLCKQEDRPSQSDAGLELIARCLCSMFD